MKNLNHGDHHQNLHCCLQRLTKRTWFKLNVVSFGLYLVVIQLYPQLFFQYKFLIEIVVGQYFMVQAFIIWMICMHLWCSSVSNNCPWLSICLIWGRNLSPITMAKIYVLSQKCLLFFPSFDQLVKCMNNSDTLNEKKKTCVSSQSKVNNDCPTLHNYIDNVL